MKVLLDGWNRCVGREGGGSLVEKKGVLGVKGFLHVAGGRGRVG